MSANMNLVNGKKKILMIVANPAVSPTTGWPVGFWWAEVTHPYWAFTEAGYDVEIRSPKGGALQADGYSDPEDASGYSAYDIVSLGFKKSAAHAALLADTKSIGDVDPRDYDAIFFAGGQSPMITRPGWSSKRWGGRPERSVRIAFIGHGNVGGALADRLQRLGHDVALAVRDEGSESVTKLLERNGSLTVASPDAALNSAPSPAHASSNVFETTASPPRRYNAQQAETTPPLSIQLKRLTS